MSNTFSHSEPTHKHSDRSVGEEQRDFRFFDQTERVLAKAFVPENLEITAAEYDDIGFDRRRVGQQRVPDVALNMRNNGIVAMLSAIRRRLVENDLGCLTAFRHADTDNVDTYLRPQ